MFVHRFTCLSWVNLRTIEPHESLSELSAPVETYEPISHNTTPNTKRTLVDLLMLTGAWELAAAGH